MDEILLDVVPVSLSCDRPPRKSGGADALVVVKTEMRNVIITDYMRKLYIEKLYNRLNRNTIVVGEENSRISG